MRAAWLIAIVCGGCTALFDLHSAPNADTDNDAVIDSRDNCPEAFNRDQSDKDADGVGDACDECLAGGTGDADGDGILDDCDECDNRDADDDDDGVPNNCDPCANTNVDTDGDGIDDGCDVCVGDRADADQDGIDDGCDPCIGNGIDLDADGLDDSCDACQGPQHDEDGDGYLDSCTRAIGPQNGSMAFDNCPAIANPDQLDNGDSALGGDGVGNLCDGDVELNRQVFDGFVVQRPDWQVLGAGWTIAQDAAIAQTPSGEAFRSLPGTFAQRIAVTARGHIQGTSGNQVEIYMVAGTATDYWPAPAITKIECFVTPAGQMRLVLDDGTGSGGKEYIGDASVDISDFTLVLSLDEFMGPMGMIGCTAVSSAGDAQAAADASIAAGKNFVVGIGASDITARFDYFNAVGR